MKILKLLVYGAILGGTLAACAGPLLFWLDLFSAAVADPTGAPPLAPYLTLTILALGLYVRILSATMTQRRAGPTTHVLTVVLLGAAIVARVFTGAPEPARAARFATFSEAPPDLRTAYAAGKLRFHVEERGIDAGGVYPDAKQELTAAFKEKHAELMPGYLYEGEERAFTLRILRGAPGPVLEPLEGDLAGTIYYAVSPDRQRYWISALRLHAEDRSRTVPFRTDGGRTVVLTNSPTAQKIIREKRAYDSGDLIRPFMP